MKIKDIINDVYQNINSNNSIFGSRTERAQVIRATKKFIRKLANDRDEQFVRLLEVSPSSLEIDFPEDATNIISVGMAVCIDGKGNTVLPLYINNSLNISSIFLRDNNDVILEDNDGLYLRGSGSGASGDSCDMTNYSVFNGGIDNAWYGSASGGYTPHKNVQGGEISIRPQYRINLEDRVIQFSSTISDEDVFVIEYIYNPFIAGNTTKWTDIEINDYYFDAIERYVYYEVARIARNISDLSKNTMKMDYISAMRSANTKVKGIKNVKQLLRKRALNIKP